MLASRQAQEALPAPMQFRFVAMFSGFLPNDPSSAVRESIMAVGPLAIPSFHCFGSADQVVAIEKSKEALTLFKSDLMTAVEHQGGHLMPSTKEVRKAFKVFLQAQQGK